MADATLNIVLKVTAGPLEQAINRAKSALKSLQSTVQGAQKSFGDLNNTFRLTASGAGSITAGFLQAQVITKSLTTAMDALKGSIGLAADFETNRISLSAMLGSMEKADTLLKELRQTAKTTPFTFTELTDATRLLVGMNVPLEEMIPTIKAIGDITAGIKNPNTSFADIAYLYGTSVASKKYVDKMDMKQFEMRGLKMREPLMDALGLKDAKQLDDMFRDGLVPAEAMKKVLADMTAEGGKFFGLMNQQTKTLQGRWSNLVDVVEELGTEVGNSLIEGLDLKQAIDNAKVFATVYKDDVMKTVIKLTINAVWAVEQLSAAFKDATTAGAGLLSGVNIIGGLLTYLPGKTDQLLGGAAGIKDMSDSFFWAGDELAKSFNKGMDNVGVGKSFLVQVKETMLKAKEDMIAASGEIAVGGGWAVGPDGKLRRKEEQNLGDFVGAFDKPGDKLADARKSMEKSDFQKKFEDLAGHMSERKAELTWKQPDSRLPQLIQKGTAEAYRVINAAQFRTQEQLQKETVAAMKQSTAYLAQIAAAATGGGGFPLVVGAIGGG